MLVEIFFVTVIYPGLTHNTPKGPFQGCVLCSLHLQLTGMTQLVITCFNLCLQKCKEEEQSQTMNDWETFLGNPLFFYLVNPPPLFFVMTTYEKYLSPWARNWIQATAATYSTAIATPDTLTHCAGPGVVSTPQQQSEEPLCHSRNSRYSLFFSQKIVTRIKKIRGNSKTVQC